MLRPHLRSATVAVAVCMLALAGCSGGGRSGTDAASGSASSATASAPSSTASAHAVPGGLPRPDHVLVVIFENENEASVIGAAAAPYLTSLAASGATFGDAHGELHPSQPNYLALFSGSTQGVTDDSCPQSFSGPNLGAQLLAAGRTFTGYSEDLPSAGFTGCEAGDYARKHNPWVDFPALPATVNQPYSAFPTDFPALPTVSILVPNLCHDMHDCGVAAGDRWAAGHLSAYASWARTHNSLLAVTFDEDRGSTDNHIATFLVGSMVRSGPSRQRIDHYSLLRTIEDMYGLAPIGKAAGAQPITDVWTTN